MAYSDHGYGSPPGRPRVSNPTTYRSGMPRIQHPAVARWHPHLHGLVTAIHEIFGLGSDSNQENRMQCLDFVARNGYDEF
jgi:hypothetical protein